MAGSRLIVDPDGGLVWRQRSVLVIADLHLEQGASFAARGVMLPPYDTPDTLSLVERLVARHRPETVIALGDSFHRDDSHQRLPDEMRGRIVNLTGSCRWIWVAGNHDPEPPAGLGGEAAVEFRIGQLTFRHQPRAGVVAGEVAGHLHPVAKLRMRGRVIRRRCFAVSALRLVMPALGAYAGGINVLDSEFRMLFPGSDFRACMLSGERVYQLSRARLVPDSGTPFALRVGAA